MLRYADLHVGMRIRAVGDWAEACWRDGDEFVVRRQATDGEFYVECHDVEYGRWHGLEATADDDDFIPFTEAT